MAPRSDQNVAPAPFWVKKFWSGHLLAAGLVEAGGGLVGAEDVAAVLVDVGPVAQLIVQIGQVAVFPGGVVDLLGGVRQVVPGPVVVGIGHTGLVEHLFVIHQHAVILVLGHAVVAPVGTADVAQGDVGEVVLIVTALHIVVQVGHIGQHAEIGVVQKLVGVHPEDVGHRVGLGGGLQLGPVLAPAGDLHLNDHIGVLGGVGITDGLHTVTLGHVPDLEGQVRLAVRRAAPTQGQQQRDEQDRCRWGNSRKEVAPTGGRKRQVTYLDGVASATLSFSYASAWPDNRPYIPVPAFPVPALSKGQ